MKKILILIALLTIFSIGKEDGCKGCYEHNGIIIIPTSDGGWVGAGGATSEYGKPDDLIKYEYEVKQDSIIFSRLDGTIIFIGKIISGGYYDNNGDYFLGQSLGEPNIRFDGYCYDSTGMKRVKRATKITACK